MDLKFHPYKSLTKEADKTAVLNSSALGFDKHSPLLYVKNLAEPVEFLSGIQVCNVSAFYQMLFSYEGILPAPHYACFFLVTLSVAHFILEIVHSDHSLVNQKRK